MFILPPPPKYYPNGSPHLAPLEALNTRTLLSSGYGDLSTPEGSYQSVDCVFVATPPPHPSDPPSVVINPLAPRSRLPSMYSRGMRLTATPLQQQQQQQLQQHQNPAGPRFRQNSNSSMKRPVLSSSNSMTGPSPSPTSPLGGAGGSVSSRFGWNFFKERERRDSTSGFSRGWDTNGSSSTGTSIRSLASTLANLSLSANPQSSSSKKAIKPKNNLAKNNSSFVSRAIVNDNLSRRFNEKIPSDDIMLWANVGRSMSWLSFPDDPLSSANATKHEALSKLLLIKAHPLCHDINLVTKSYSNLEVVVGTSAGDILWVDMVSNKYNRINKNGDVTHAAVVDIRWVPNSENYFVTVHADGLVCLWDKEREDGYTSSLGGNPAASNGHTAHPAMFRVETSFHGQTSKVNPVAVYRISNSPLSSIDFSPNGSTVCISASDGFLRVIDLLNEKLIDVYPSYYGGFTCATFSPDGHFIAAGGQDDNICVFSTISHSLVARLEGHTSWISAVKFDTFNCDGDNYRIGSVGEDGKIMLWDFSPRTLTISKPQQSTTASSAALNTAKKKQATDGPSLAVVTEGQAAAAAAAAVNSPSSSRDSIVHPFRPYTSTPLLRPVSTRLVKLSQAESEPLSDIAFLDKFILVASKDSRIWTWKRP